MAVTVFGRLAVEVEQPGGEIVKYLLEPLPPANGCWRRWLVTGPEGRAYRVALYPDDSWHCECRDFAHRFRWCRARPRGSPCKHCVAVADALAGEGNTDGGGVDQARGAGPGGGPADPAAGVRAPGGRPESPGRAHPGGPVPGADPGQPADAPVEVGVGRRLHPVARRAAVDGAGVPLPGAGGVADRGDR